MSLTDGAVAPRAAGVCALLLGRLMVNTAPPPRLSSTVRTPLQERQRLARDRQAGADAADDAALLGGGGGEAGQEGAVLVLDARAVVADADHLTVVEDRDDHVRK